MVESPSQLFRSLWPDDEVEASSNDGFLRIKNCDDDKAEEQPLLLHSTSRLLRGLYPKMSLPEIITCPGFKEEIKTEAVEVDHSLAEATSHLSIEQKNTQSINIPPEYQIYQDLVRVENINTWMNTALKDIQIFRHRAEGSKRPNEANGNAKVKALQKQQQRLLQMRSESNVSKETDKTDEGVDMDGENDDDADDMEEYQTPTMRMVRTLNSIRALYPHLLPMLNHPRRNDTSLVIKTTCYKTRRRGTTCWLLGTVGFDTSTTKAAQATHLRATTILTGFINVRLAEQICNDSRGCPDFWPTSWLRQLQERCNPVILNPIEILSTKLNKSPSEMLAITKALDKSHPGNGPSEFDQKYQKSVSNLQRRLSNILTGRFHGARLSLYGSCLSNLSLGKGSDVDLSLWIPEADFLKKGFQDGTIKAEEYHRRMTSLVYQANRKLAFLKSEFRDMVAVTRARISVISGTFIHAENPYTEDGSIE
jgi:hypothetical protein